MESIMKILLCFMIPLLLFLGFLEKQSRHRVLFLLLGSLMCIPASLVNSWIYQSTGMTYFYLTTTVAPMVEESVKFLPVLLFTLLAANANKQVIPVSFSVGIGFAVTECLYTFILNPGTVTFSWLIVRGIGTSLMHSMTTVIVGYGVYRSFKYRRLILAGTISTLCLAIMYHGAYNCLVSTDSLKFCGVLLPILTYGAIILIFYRRTLKLFFLRNDLALQEKRIGLCEEQVELLEKQEKLREKQRKLQKEYENLLGKEDSQETDHE